jgi:hypothetical protein
MKQGRDDFAELIRERLADTETAWSIGGFGAIAEFMRDADAVAFCSISASVSSRPMHASAWQIVAICEVCRLTGIRLGAYTEAKRPR